MSGQLDASEHPDSEHQMLSMFEEPASFRPPSPEPTFIPTTLPSGLHVRLRLVGHNPLWGHHLWNAGRVLSTYLGEHAAQIVRSRDVFELGAGAGLPGITAWAEGARKVVLTDYPDADLIANLEINIAQAKQSQEEEARAAERCDQSSGGGSNQTLRTGTGSICATGYLWGAPLPEVMEEQCDTLICGDLLFNHSEHDKLVDSLMTSLKKKQDSVALIFFTPYRPWLLESDLNFFEKVRGKGLFTINKVLETVMDKVMFEEDSGDELMRRTVYGYEIRWK